MEEQIEAAGVWNETLQVEKLNGRGRHPKRVEWRGQVEGGSGGALDNLAWRGLGQEPGAGGQWRVPEATGSISASRRYLGPEIHWGRGPKSDEGWSSTGTWTMSLRLQAVEDQGGPGGGDRRLELRTTGQIRSSSNRRKPQHSIYAPHAMIRFLSSPIDLKFRKLLYQHYSLYLV
ncbi:uncharacterized protein BKA55DRAFT_539637 [Fusarium redolens]|uniref:Uncharacterized protein n=1 Tax=Fusarium redolens TaxID=48865 RepID=A0A9P9H472_FUSRE|nr:uncharacterized protein BKA55DRAFT_539637 [Fusarium redolens]KAH7250070.1 hypothetical protein BKA55DRAFT_539637 [Fusarium redolens]